MRFHFGQIRCVRLLIALALAAGATAATAAATGESPASPGIGLGQVLRMTLATNRDIQVSRVRVEKAGGVVLQTQGAFDTQLSIDLLRSKDRSLLSEAEKLAYPGIRQAQADAAGISAGVEKQLAMGATLSGSISSSHANTDLAMAAGTPGQTTRKIVVGVRVPLARGAGEHNAALAAEQAAQFDWQAALAQKRFSVSQAVRDTAIAFWDYLGSARQLDIARRGEERTAGLIEELRKLIAADEIPAADLDLALANHSERINARIGAEQALLQARQKLALTMGLGAAELAGMPMPAGDFPIASAATATTAATTMTTPDAAGLLVRTLPRRGDWLALERQIEALRERVAAARDLTLPQVDMAINLSSSGLREGNSLNDGYRPYAGSFAGPSISTQLNIKFPFANQTASGQLRQATAALAEAEIQREALRSQIAAAVETTAADLLRSSESLRVSADIVARYARTLANERTRRRLGAATLIDVINVEDRYFRALIDDVQRRRNYAVSVARRVHETGILLRTAPGEGKTDDDATDMDFEIREADLMRADMPET